MNRLRTYFQEFHPIVYSLIVGTVFVRAAQSMSMPFLALYLAKSTDMSPLMIGLTIGAGPLAGTVGGFIGGAISDRIGRRRVMMTALYTWVFVFIGFAFGKGMLFFMLLNALSGLCRAVFEPVSQALMADLTDKEKRFRVFSMRYLAINIGVAVGPLLGAYLGQLDSTIPFIVTGVVYLIYALVLQALMKYFGIQQIEGEGQKKERVTFRGAWNVITHDVALRYFIVGGMIVSLGYSQMTVTLSQYVGKSFTDGIELFSYLMSLNAIVVVTCQMWLSKWAEKRTPLTSIVIGVILYTVGLLGFGLSGTWLTFMVSMFVFTLGEILTFPASSVFIDNLARDGMRGTYFGAQSFTSLGHALGPSFGGWLLSMYGGSTMMITIAVITLFSIAFYYQGQRIFTARTGKVMEMAKTH
ncbi:MDR family MFS transporter [Brevibacillus dissolubilis]|uniref:MDR family MFS transporter n=1 Tax=Brevibacillus dissolubilis TaxID=1844116 RepID=UPI001117051B|nr:MFS transporter [Brevibacillus dissolubilis]